VGLFGFGWWVPEVAGVFAECFELGGAQGSLAMSFCRSKSS